MFHTASPYSPFFTSGLLSNPSSWSVPEPAIDFPRRGSLPDTSRSSNSDGNSSFYVAFQARRDPNELRSFLSLDLAESLRSKPQSLLPERSTRSRDSFRAIPSPKPVPSSSLPQVPGRPPKASTSKLMSPRLPTIPSASSSAVDLSSSNAPAPALIREVAALHRRPTQQSSTTVSTGYRKTKRSDALARLEGRLRTATAPHRRDFMNLSDDDDRSDSGFEADSDDESSSDEHLELERFKRKRSTISFIVAASDDDSDIVPRSPFASRSSHARSQSSYSSMIGSKSSSLKRKRPPFKSFIDLREREDDNSSQWNWRSFIEIATVA